MSILTTNNLNLTLQVWELNSNQTYERSIIIDEIINLQTTYKFVNASTCTLTIPYNPSIVQQLKVNNMITLHTPENLGQAETEPFIITMITIATNEDGTTTIQVQGSNPLIWLNRRIILWDSFNMSGTPTEIVEDILNAQALNCTDEARIIPNLSVGSTPSAGVNATFIIQQPFQNLLATITKLLKAYNLGQNITFNLETGAFLYNILQGTNKSIEAGNIATVGNNTLIPVVFSPQYGNITGDSFQHTNVNLVNVCYGSVTIDNTQYTTTTGSATGLNRFEGSVSASSTGATTITVDNYQEVLTLLAEQKMAQDAENQTSLGTIKETGGYKYNIDFNLGDTITYLNTEWGVELSALVTEVNQQWSCTGKVTQVQLGQPMPTISQLLGITA